MAKLRIGTCSWKYDSWRGVVYSHNEKINYLEEYSQKFDTVEIDQWFWSLGKAGVKLPSVKVVKEYSASVPSDFKFSVKLPNSLTLTHYYRRNKTAKLIENPYFLSLDLTDEFLKTLKPLESFLGPLMFQFEYLNKEKMPGRIHFQALFGSYAKKLPNNFNYAVEIRNPNYLCDEYFRFLKELNFSHVFLQGYYMPSIFDVFEKWKNYLISPVVIRLHGAERNETEKLTDKNWNRIVLPKDAELDKLAGMIKLLLEKKLDVYVNVNNHYEGSAPLTIDRINERLEMVL